MPEGDDYWGKLIPGEEVVAPPPPPRIFQGASTPPEKVIFVSNEGILDPKKPHFTSGDDWSSI